MYYTFCFYEIKAQRTFIPRYFFNDEIFAIYDSYVYYRDDKEVSHQIKVDSMQLTSCKGVWLYISN